MTKALLATLLIATLAIVGAATADAPTCFTIEGVGLEPDFVGVVNEGLRLEQRMEGSVVEGFLAGSIGQSGTNYALVRHDGVIEIEVRTLLVDPDGAPVTIALRGYTGDPTTMPPLEAYFDPDFVPADVDTPFHGAAWLQTMAPQYAFVNHTVFAATGTINHFTSQIRVTYCAIAE